MIGFSIESLGLYAARGEPILQILAAKRVEPSAIFQPIHQQQVETGGTYTHTHDLRMSLTCTLPSWPEYAHFKSIPTIASARTDNLGLR